MTMSYCLPLERDFRDARRLPSDHRFFERFYRRVRHILGFKEATSCGFSVCESETRPNVLELKDAISRVMHSPMSFFETTVRTLESAGFPFR